MWSAFLDEADGRRCPYKKAVCSFNELLQYLSVFKSRQQLARAYHSEHMVWLTSNGSTW
jgi:hypothetical protein